MNYIRTEDGRIAEVKEDMMVKPSEYGSRLVYKDHPIVCVLYGNDKIVKEADDIMELFDAIFEFFPDDNRPYCQLYYRNVDGKLYRYWNPRSCAEPLKGNIIRGVIYTDKAIIYVAKLNDKEEWELL